MFERSAPHGELVFYTRADCRLCEEAKEEIRKHVGESVPGTFWVKMRELGTSSGTRISSQIISS